MLLSKAAEGFILSKRADGRKPKSIEVIAWALARLVASFGAREVDSIGAHEYRDWVIALNECADIGPRSRQMIVLHTKAFFHWCQDEGYADNRPDARIRVPTAPEPQVVGFTHEEVLRMMKSAVFTRVTKADTTYNLRNPLGLRNRAILLTLLSTGCRAGELCRLNMGDVNLETGEVHVMAGKTELPRTTYADNAARKAIWKYLALRGEWRPDEPLFLSDDGLRMTVHALQMLCRKIGERAKVPNAHPHRWRHTFAIQFLKNGGDLPRLRILLGHSSIVTTQIYTKFSQPDVAAIHAATSAGDRWRL